jgi:hypothetical protein
VSQEEELAGRGGSGGEAETEEKSRDVVRESKGQASAETAQASPGPEVGGSRSMVQVAAAGGGASYYRKKAASWGGLAATATAEEEEEETTTSRE